MVEVYDRSKEFQRRNEMYLKLKKYLPAAWAFRIAVRFA